MNSEQPNQRQIGILGGMGPAASANLYQRMIAYAQHRHQATQDADYPPIIINSLPLAGFDETGINDSEKVRRQLLVGVKRLETAGCGLIVIACNTVHAFHAELQAGVSIPIFNVIAEVHQAVAAEGISRVGLLSSQSTNVLQLYPKAFAGSGIEVIGADPLQQLALNRVIEHVMSGRQGLADIVALKDIARDYMKQGAEAIILGCTEIPLAMNQSHTDMKLFDSLDIMAQLAVDWSLQKLPA